MSWFEGKNKVTNKAEGQPDDSVEVLNDELTARAEVLLGKGSHLSVQEKAAVKAMLDGYRAGKFKDTFATKVTRYEEFNESGRKEEKTPSAPKALTKSASEEAEKKPPTMSDLIVKMTAKKLASEAQKDTSIRDESNQKETTKVDDDVLVSKRTDKAKAHQEAVEGMKGFEGLAGLQTKTTETRTAAASPGGMAGEKAKTRKLNVELAPTSDDDRGGNKEASAASAESLSEADIVKLAEQYKTGNQEVLKAGQQNKIPSVLVNEAQAVLRHLNVPPESMKAFDTAIKVQFDELKNSPKEAKKEAHKSFEINFLTIVGDVIREFENRQTEPVVEPATKSNERSEPKLETKPTIEAASVDAVVNQFLTNFESPDTQIKHQLRNHYRDLFEYGSQNPTEKNREALNQLNYAYLMAGKYSKVTAALAENPNDTELQGEQAHLRQEIEDSFKTVLELAAAKNISTEDTEITPPKTQANSKADALKADEFEANKLTDADYAADEMDAYEAGKMPVDSRYQVKSEEEQTSTKDEPEETITAEEKKPEPLILTQDQRLDSTDTLDPVVETPDSAESSKSGTPTEGLSSTEPPLPPEPPTPGGPENPEWQKRADLKHDWLAARKELHSQINQKNFKANPFALGLAWWNRREARKNMKEARTAYMNALVPALEKRGDYRTYFAQRFVLDEGNMTLDQQVELLSPKQRELMQRLQGNLKKYKWPLRIGSVVVAGTMVTTGTALAGAGIGSVLVAGGGAASRRATGMLLAGGAGMLAAGATYRSLDSRVGRKKDQLIATNDRIQTESYNRLMNNTDDFINEYTNKYQAYTGAKKTRNIGAVAAGVGAAALVGGRSEEIIDSLEQINNLDAPLPEAPEVMLETSEIADVPITEIIDDSVEDGTPSTGAEIPATGATTESGPEDLHEGPTQPQAEAETETIPEVIVSAETNPNIERFVSVAETEAVRSDLEPTSAEVDVIPPDHFYEAEAGDNFWDIMEGDTNAVPSETVAAVSAEHKQALIDLVRDRVNELPQAERSSLGFGATANDLAKGAEVNLTELDRIAHDIAVEKGWIAPAVAEASEASTPSAAFAETIPEPEVMETNAGDTAETVVTIETKNIATDTTNQSELPATVQQEWEARLTPAMNDAEKTELLQNIANRNQFVQFLDAQLSDPDHNGFSGEFGKLSSDRFIDALEADTLEQMLSNYNIENPRYAELLEELKRAGILERGQTLNESLETGLSKGRVGIDYNPSNPTLTIIRPGVFSSDYVLPLATDR